MQYLLRFTRVLLVAALAPFLSAADFTISTVSLPVAQLNQPYNQTLSTQGGVDPITWTLSGTLPNGLRFSPSGVLSGSATNIDVQNVSFTARDSSGKNSSANFDLSTANGDISITSRTLPQAFAGEAYTAQLQSSGGKPLYKYSLLGAPLPAGLTLDPTGAISGTPQFIGLEFISFRVIDEAGNSAATRVPSAVSRNGIRFANLTPAIGSIGKVYRERITIENAPSGFVVRPSAFASDRRATVLSLDTFLKGQVQGQEFFEQNYFTTGMLTLVDRAFRHLSGTGAGSSVFMLSQAMGGGKTHSMIALGLLASEPDLRRAILGKDDPAPKLGRCRVVGFNGRNTDAAGGIWGSIAEQLGKGGKSRSARPSETRVFSFRIFAVKNSTKRNDACSPAADMIVGTPAKPKFPSSRCFLLMISPPMLPS